MFQLSSLLEHTIHRATDYSITTSNASVMLLALLMDISL
jgi:hypothetical protein